MDRDYVLLKSLPGIPAKTKGKVVSGVIMFTSSASGKIMFYHIPVQLAENLPAWFQKDLTFDDVDDGIEKLEKLANGEENE